MEWVGGREDGDMLLWSAHDIPFSFFLFMDSRERETQCSVLMHNISDIVYRMAGRVGVGGISESPGRLRGCHNRVSSLWDDFPSCFLSAFLCSVSQSLLRLCSSVQEPFLRVMSSTAISPLLPRPRSPFRITLWKAATYKLRNNLHALRWKRAHYISTHS